MATSSPHDPAARPLGRMAAAGRTGRIRARLKRFGTTLPVVALLAGLAIAGYWTDWSIPRFSTLIGRGDQATQAWCTTHNVPQAQCIECNPGLIPKEESFGWCPEHGIPDCPLEHPEVAQINKPVQITDADRQRAARALALRPRIENNSRCPSHARYIQFASAQAVDKAGVDIALVDQRPLIEAIVANGEVIYDQNRMAHLASRAAGTVWRVDKQVGDRAQKGEVLALVDANEVGRTKTELLQGLTQRRLREENYKRLISLQQTGAVTAKSVREAEAALEEATVNILSAQQALVNLGLPFEAKAFYGLSAEETAKRIQFLGLPSDFIATIDPSTTTSNLVPILSPMDGSIVERDVVAGEVVQPSTTLFTVADTRTMWLTLAVRQEEAHLVQLGQPVRFQPSDRGPHEQVQGTVAWLSSAADAQTRTVSVRIQLDNADARLRANTFGTGRIILREEPAAITVPNDAIHGDGDCTIVFVRDKHWFQKDSPKFFHVRKVRLGVRTGDATEVIAGLLPGEVVASKNSNVLEAQLLKSDLGAGCGCTE